MYGPDSEEAVNEQLARETNEEIFRYAFDDEPHENDGIDTDAMVDRTHEDMEAPDGTPIPLAEHAREIMDAIPVGTAGMHPTEREQTLQAELAKVNEWNRGWKQAYDQVKNEPVRRAEDAYLYEANMEQRGIRFDSPEHRDAFRRSQQERDQLIRDLNTDRINMSMNHARGQDRARFDAAAESFNRMDPNHPVVNSIANDVMSSPDPGSRFMSYAHQGLPSLNSLTPAWDAGGRTTGGGVPRSSRSPSEISRGWGSSSQDFGDTLNDEIFNSAWDVP